MKNKCPHLFHHFVLLTFLVVSCQATPSAVDSVKATPIITSPVAPIIPATAIPRTATQIPSLIQILASQPSYFWWSADSQKIFYETNTFWEFDITTGLSKETQEQRQNSLPCEKLPDLFNEVTIFQQECSPSGKKLTYYTLRPGGLTATPLPADCNQGICSFYEGSAVDMWVLEDGEPRRIGELVSCIKDHKWAEDEQRLIAVGYDGNDRPSPPMCDYTYYVWSVDLFNNQITPLLSKEDHPSEVFVHDYAPDGRFLLYTELRKLYILDVQTYAIVNPIISREIFNAWWINEHKILISFYLSTGEYNMGLGILDTRNGKFIELLSEANAIGEFILGNPVVSPDEKWVAFTARYPSKGLYGFWLLQLEEP